MTLHTESDNATSTQRTNIPLLCVRGLSQRFNLGGLIKPRVLHAVTDVSFGVQRGEVVALVGESGSGKSTIARSIARLTTVSEGKIIFRGRDILAEEPKRASVRYRSEVQMIFQDPFGSLNPVHTVGHHISRPLRIHHKASGRDDVRSKAAELFETVGLTPGLDYLGKFPHQLSGGQRQRISIARALAVDPELILADEPISMLDVSIRMGVLNLIRRLQAERGIAFLYITHDIASARYIANKTMAMYAGRLVEGADSEELIKHPAHPYTQLLLSAVPNPDRAAPGYVQSSPAPPPSLFDVPRGCPFASRCPYVMPVCREIMPGVTNIGVNHWVRCHLYEDGNEAPRPLAEGV